MDYIITFEDGSSAYLEHHGVMGMKWGVRNAETQAKYAGGNGGQVRGNGVAPYARQRRARIGSRGARNAEALSNYASGVGPMPTRRQIRSAVRYNERQTYKRGGGLFGGGQKVVGKNTAEVHRKHREALDNDAEYQRLKLKSEAAKKDYERASRLESSTRDLFENTMNDETKKEGYRAAAAIGSGVAKANTYAKREAWSTASLAEHAHREKVGRQYLDQYKDAFVKDIGFKDVEAGKKFLSDQNMEAFLNRRAVRYARRVE